MVGGNCGRSQLFCCSEVEGRDGPPSPEGSGRVGVAREPGRLEYFPTFPRTVLYFRCNGFTFGARDQATSFHNRGERKWPTRLRLSMSLLTAGDRRQVHVRNGKVHAIMLADLSPTVLAHAAANGVREATRDTFAGTASADEAEPPSSSAAPSWWAQCEYATRGGEDRLAGGDHGGSGKAGADGRRHPHRAAGALQAVLDAGGDLKAGSLSRSGRPAANG